MTHAVERLSVILAHTVVVASLVPTGGYAAVFSLEALEAFTFGRRGAVCLLVALAHALAPAVVRTSLNVATLSRVSWSTRAFVSVLVAIPPAGTRLGTTTNVTGYAMPYIVANTLPLHTLSMFRAS